MNILFVLYGDFRSNSANPLVLFARELRARGHTCAIAVPANLDSVSLHENAAFIPTLFGNVLASPNAVFPDGRSADVIHACTPREVVRHFVTAYMALRPTPLVIYLEDHESWIATRALGLDEATLVFRSEKEISEGLPDIFSHPLRYDSFIGLADAVAVIQDKLKFEVPPWVHCETVMPGVDLEFFSPRSPDIFLREKYGVTGDERVIVYHGGLDQFKLPAIETLCKAVGLINQQGYACRLLRAGLGSLEFLKWLPPDTVSAINDLGMLPKHELPDLLALADVFVQPGEIDPFEDLRLPGKVPEFLAMARPVILPDVGIAHLFKDGVDAVLLRSGSAAEIAEKCIGVFSDSRRADMIGRAGRRLAEKHFDVKLQACRLEEIYQFACKNFNPAIASEVWRAAHKNNSVASLLVSKLLLLADSRDQELGFEPRDMLKAHARYIDSMQRRVEGLIGRDGEMARLTRALAERGEQIVALNQIAADQREKIFRLERSEQQLASVLSSKSWKITRPLRVFRRFVISRSFTTARRVISDSCRALWHRLPLSTRFKQRLKSIVVRHFPWLFRGQAWEGFHPPAGTNGASMNTPFAPHAADMRLYVPLLNGDPLESKAVKLICFYLPQFHPIPENDTWWGKGFTEWLNVKPARPQFERHYQPHVPGELGYYNLLDGAVQRRQVELAKLYGIEGFCFYFYWFGGVRLLEAPTQNYLADASLDLPFCLCWANENWSRRWDGLDSDVLIAQRHSAEDDIAFIEYIARYMRDTRYIRINGKPLLLVYRPNLLPSAKETAARWREWCRANSLGEIYLAYTQSFEVVDPAKYGFDAAIEFPPNNSAPPNITRSVKPLEEDFACTVYDWEALVKRSANYKRSDYKIFRSVCPSWDNTARRKSHGTVFVNNTPALYQRWLDNAIREAIDNVNPDERLIFVNAWNEWAEGAHLEPDQRYGYAYLEATRLAMIRGSLGFNKRPMVNERVVAFVIHAYYEDAFAEILENLQTIVATPIKIYVTTTLEKEERVRKLLAAQPREFLLRVVENRGRDILPFLKIFPEVLRAKHAFFVKVHTKKSLHRKDGDAWRNDLYSKLISNESIADAIRVFNNDARIGILGPDGHLVAMSYFWGSNAARVAFLTSRMGVDLAMQANLNFVAGSMFIARVDAMLPLLNLAINEAEFEPELGQIDGTLAHAIERLFPVSALSVGLITTCPNNVALTEYEFVKH